MIALRLLSIIPVEPEHASGYRRDDWPHWQQGRSKCISVREEVLIAESQTVVVMSPDGCTVTSGSWVDGYSGSTITDPRQLDVDHLVPLEEAHQSGGWEWSRDKRAQFANNLADPNALVAVSASANRAKGSKGPEAWLPPNLAYACEYMKTWIAIKTNWNLSMDDKEFDFLKEAISHCN